MRITFFSYLCILVNLGRLMKAIVINSFRDDFVPKFVYFVYLVDYSQSFIFTSAKYTNFDRQVRLYAAANKNTTNAQFPFTQLNQFPLVEYEIILNTTDTRISVHLVQSKRHLQWRQWFCWYFESIKFFLYLQNRRKKTYRDWRMVINNLFERRSR